MVGDEDGQIYRPPLPIGALPEPLWRAGQARLARLPFSRLRHQWQFYGLYANERRVARRLAALHDLDDSQRESFEFHYAEAFKRLSAEAVPQFVPSVRAGGERSVAMSRTDLPRPRVRVVPIGWDCWFGNRRAGIRDRWFRLTWRY
jgi:hypothetical protein